MNKKYIFLALLFILPIILFLLFNSAEHHYRLNILTKDNIKTLQVYNPKSSYCSQNEEDSVHHILDFNFLSQNNQSVTKESLKGQIYVAGFFFTTCPGICIDMTKQLRRVQEAFQVYKDFKILYHTVNPSHDSVTVLRAYSEKNQIDDNIWYLLTGNQTEIYKQAHCSYFVAAEYKKQEFIHTDKFILVDREGRIRGFYTGTDKVDVDRLITEIKILMFDS